MEVRSNTKATL
uniref:Uncharacterized protein n=1 Tax=Arundo donax TaxID=35708 RepID=A0A0A9F678_ARUDO